MLFDVKLSSLFKNGNSCAYENNIEFLVIIIAEQDNYSAMRHLT